MLLLVVRDSAFGSTAVTGLLVLISVPVSDPEYMGTYFPLMSKQKLRLNGRDRVNA